MNRNDFGLWGLELNSEDFACALAAVGTMDYWHRREDMNVESAFLELRKAVVPELKKERPISWGFPRWLESFGARGAIESVPPAGILAIAWKKLAQSKKITGRPRFEIHATTSDWPNRGIDLESDAIWIAEQLSYDEVRGRSVYISHHDGGYEIGWDWPLRVGFLTDPASQQLRQQLDNNYWKDKLWEPVELGSGRDDCDLLLLPFDLRESLAIALGTRGNLRADCVLVLGEMTGIPEDTLILLKGLCSQIRTGGTGVVHIPVSSRAEWFNHLIEELSHDLTLDAALFGARRQVQAHPPLLLFNHRLGIFSRVSRMLNKLSDRFANLSTYESEINISPQVAWNLQMPEGPQPLRKIGEQLRAIKPSLPWDSEKRAATIAAELGKDSRATLASLPPTEPSARWIRAQVIDKSNPANKEPLIQALKANAPHALTVSIGAKKEGWLSDESKPFPMIPEDETDRWLTVVFAEPRLAPEPQVTTLRLPPRGDSEDCNFYFHTRDITGPIEARITVLHRNRVLQTALLRATILDDPLQAPPGTQIELAIEAVVRPGMDGLPQRNRFDAALIFNHDTAHRPGITKIADRHASVFSPDALGIAVKEFDNDLSAIADDPNAFEGGLEGDKTTELLHKFAKHGSLLFRNIVKDQINDQVIANAQRLQIISTRAEARLPIEFLYDRKVPKPDAKLCPHAKQALENGRHVSPNEQCTSSCPSQNDQGTVICPLGFWGVNRVIERHAYDPRMNNLRPNWDFTLQAEPVADRKHLDALHNTLMAASHRVDKKLSGGVDKVKTEIEISTHQTPEFVLTWKDWEAQIAAKSPSLLILLVHTEISKDELQEIEIGEGEWLEVVYLEDKHLRNSKEAPPPLVLLIGCETGAPKIEFHGFVAQMRDQGAAIVVSTGATILGRHAVPVTIEFVRELARLSKVTEASFGDVMLRVRQRLLAQGLPMVLCLMSYGDADWRLGANTH